MKFKSQVFTEASGSVGGLTYSHNRGGMYTRARAIPVNPNTPQQQAVRQFMATLTSAWNNTLTPAQRTAWETYALNVPLPDRLGEPRNVGGIGMYIRTNVPILQEGTLTRVDAGPVVYNLGDYTAPAIASITAPTALSLTFDDTDAWANEDGAAMLVYGSRGVNPTINFFKGPYRFASAILGDAITPPTSPAAIVMPFTLTATQRAFVRVLVVRADGRISSSFRAVGLVV